MGAKVGLTCPALFTLHYSLFVFHSSLSTIFLPGSVARAFLFVFRFPFFIFHFSFFIKNIKNRVTRKRDGFLGSIPPTDDEKPNDRCDYVTHGFREDVGMQTESPVYARRTNRPARIPSDQNFSERGVYS